MRDGRILLGVIGRPHGVRGLVHVQSYTADPAALTAYGPLADEAGRRWTVAWRRDGVAELRDDAGRPVADRDAAARLTNTRLFIERDRLPPPPKDEFYLSDLVGMDAQTPDGATIGRVATVHDYGAGASLEIEGGVLVPFTKACVPHIDLANRRLTILLPDEIIVEGAEQPLPPQPESAEAQTTHPLASTPWCATILTLFPSMFPGPLGHSLAGRALERGQWSLEVKDIRDAATDRHRTVDDTPYGGGAGMVMRPDVLDAAIATLADAVVGNTGDRPLLYLSPRGAPLTQARVRELAAGPGVTLVCGRYEGVDQRVLDARGIEEVSVGDYVLSGGELAAMVLLDACIRLLPGTMGAAASGDDESFAGGLLEYPHYTKPAVWQGHAVPEILLSGHHGAIAAWRREQSEHLTRARRPDLWRARMDNAAARP